MNRTGAELLYRQVEKSLRQGIEKGRYTPGQRLPDERQMAQEYGVSRVTVRQALHRLGQARLIERVQGCGTFVSGTLQRAGYLCVLAVGPTVRFSSYVGTMVAQAEHSAHSQGLQLSVRYLKHAEEVQAAIAQIDINKTVAAGLLVGDDLRSLIRPWVVASRIPWVVVGDFAEEVRGPVVIDQVVGDNYHLVETAARVLVERGVRQAALFVQGAAWVWSCEKISAFRAVLDEAGVAARHQQVFDLYASVPTQVSRPATHRRAVVEAALAVFDRWQQSDRWPEGILLSGALLDVWDHCLSLRPAAAGKLEAAQLVVWDFEERRAMDFLSAERPRLTWVLLSMAAMTDRAVARLAERSFPNHKPVRDYIRQVRVVSCQTGATASPHATNAASCTV